VPPPAQPPRPGRFPDKSTGDRLFSGDLDAGFEEYIIVAKDDNHQCLVVRSYFDTTHPPQCFIAMDYFFKTMAEAIAAVARADLDFYTRGQQFSQAALDAVEAGADLSRFIAGRNEVENPPPVTAPWPDQSSF
jgi:hypothetical protein